MLVWGAAMMVGCEQPGLRGRLTGPAADSVFLYQQRGLVREKIMALPCEIQGEAMAFSMPLEGLEPGWYFLGVAPNQLTQVLLKPDEHLQAEGSLAQAGIRLKGTEGVSAHETWVMAEQQFYVQSQAVEATRKMALYNLDEGNRSGYADYAALAYGEQQKLTSWLDSLRAVDPWLAREFELKRPSLYLPEGGELLPAEAFSTHDRAWRKVLENAGEAAGKYPGLGIGVQQWMELLLRDQPEAEGWRPQVNRLLAMWQEGTLAHQNALAAVLSVLDERENNAFADFARQYIALYGGNRRMESYVQGRIRLYEDRQRQEERPARTYGLEP